MAYIERHRKRIPFKSEVVLHSNAYHYPLEAKLIDISLAGAYLKTEDFIPLGYDCRVDVVLTGACSKVTISIEGTVVRRDTGGLGVKFKEGVSPWAVLPLFSLYGWGKSDGMMP